MLSPGRATLVCVWPTASPLPLSLPGRPQELAVADWLPDGNRFIVNARPAVFDADWSSIGTDIWLISTKGATPRLLRRNALGWSVSPDGASIAFTTEKKDLGDREIWLMDVDNGVARRIFEAEKNEGFGGVLWLADGKRLLYLSIGPAGNRLLSRDLRVAPHRSSSLPPKSAG